MIILYWTDSQKTSTGNIDVYETSTRQRSRKLKSSKRFRTLKIKFIKLN